MQKHRYLAHYTDADFANGPITVHLERGAKMFSMVRVTNPSESVSVHVQLNSNDGENNDFVDSWVDTASYSTFVPSQEDFDNGFIVPVTIATNPTIFAETEGPFAITVEIWYETPNNLRVIRANYDGDGEQVKTIRLPDMSTVRCVEVQVKTGSISFTLEENPDATDDNRSSQTYCSDELGASTRRSYVGSTYDGDTDHYALFHTLQDLKFTYDGLASRFVIRVWYD